VDLVIEKALKQDIGPDGSLGLKRRNFKLQEDLPLSHELKQYRRTYDPRKPDEMLQKEDFDYRENYADKLKAQLNTEKKKPISFINPPLMRAEARRKFMIKTLQKKDIHWKNLPLLARFLNEGGKMMNRYQTRLPGNIHKKLTKTIKHARNMGLLPNSDFVKPYHKIPFTSLYNEFAEDIAKVVDKKSGIIKVIHQPSLQDKYNYSSFDSAVEANKNNFDR
jgi:ribosomal protein S18